MSAPRPVDGATPAGRSTGLRRLSATLPPGTIPVGVGIAVSGICAYGFLVLPAATDRLTPEAYAGVSALWFLVFTLAPGVFMPLEQETARAVAHRRAARSGARPVVVRSAQMAVVIAAVLMVLTVAGWSVLERRLFDGEGALNFAVLVAVSTFVPYFVARGVLAGTDTFRAYGWLVAADGLARVTLAGVLVVAGVSSPAPYGLAVGLAPLIAVLVVVPVVRPRLEDGPSRSWSDLSSAVGLLISAQIAAALVLNSVPLAVTALAADTERAAAGRLSAAFVLARVPLFLFQAVQASMVPRLAALAATGDRAEFRHTVVRLVSALVGVVTVGVAGAAVAGPPLVELLFGSEFAIGRRDMVLLTAGSGVLMIAVALSQALLADRRFGAILAGWVAAVATFAGATALGDDLFLRVEVAFLAAALVATALFAVRVLHEEPA